MRHCTDQVKKESTYSLLTMIGSGLWMRRPLQKLVNFSNSMITVVILLCRIFLSGN